MVIRAIGMTFRNSGGSSVGAGTAFFQSGGRPKFKGGTASGFLPLRRVAGERAGVRWRV